MTTIPNFSQYQSPGVYVSINENPSVSTAGINLNPTVICLVGEAPGIQNGADTVIATETIPTPSGAIYTAGGRNSNLTQYGIVGSSLTITDVSGSSTNGYSYSVGPESGAGNEQFYYTQSSSNFFGGNPLNTITSIFVNSGYTPSGSGASSIGPTALLGLRVQAQYQYTNSQYYQPTTFGTFNALQTFYGPALNASGTIISPLTLAAYFAFNNGAQSVMAQAVLPGDTSTWTNTLAQLANQPSITVIVPVTGDTTIVGGNGIHEAVVNLVSNQLNSSQPVLMRAFLGQDATQFSSTTNGTIIQEATNWANTAVGNRVTVISPALIQYNTGAVAGIISIGGQYLAAAIAGVFAAQGGVWIPITRKQVVGFTSIPMQGTLNTLTQQQTSGVTTCYQRRDGTIVIQQGLTTNMSNFLTQELSIQAGADALYDLMENAIQSQGLIGSPFLSTTPTAVVGAVAGALNYAQNLGLLYSYTQPQFVVPALSPTTVQIQFTYQPTLPLNYIVVQFSIDSTAGTLQFQSTPATSGVSS